MHKTNLKSNRPTTRGALGDGDLDFKLTYDDAVPGDTVWTFSDVDVGDVPQGYAGYSSLNILCPDELTFHYTLPAGWSATESDQGGMRSLNFYISNPAANGQPADVERFLQSLSTSFTLTTPWDYPPVGSEISVMIDAVPTSGFIDSNGELHIYEFIPGTITWLEAYNAAHARIVNGEHGYLATLASLEEELFVYGSIAKSPGWLGGTRLRYTDGAKIDGSRAIDAQGNISTDINDYTYNTSIANQWYWADGASENGLVFYGTPTVDNTNGPIPGVFSFFSGWYTYNKYPQYQSIIYTFWQEPNNYSGEYCLQFAQDGYSSWNDLEYNRADHYYNSGYYVEYGPFPVGTGFTGRGSANLEIPLQYDVRFDVNNPDCPLTYPNQSLWTGETITNPAAGNLTVGTVYPQYGNRKFLGWFTSPSAVNPFDFSTPVESSLVNSGSSAIVLYGRWSAPVALTAAKSAVGSPLPNGEFEFGVFDSNGNLVSVGTADSSGNIAFPDLQIDAAGTYNYTIREISIDGAGWTVDRSSYPVVVTAAANGQGQLTASAAYPNGVPGFVNTYSGTPTSESVYVYKELLGWNHPELQFEFGLYDDSGNLLETAQNSNGVVQFPLITYAAPGVYNYTVREITTSGDGWTTDSNIYLVTVTVTDDGTGNLIADTDYPQGQPIFVNTYAAAPATVQVSAAKSANGGTLEADQFEFELYDENGNFVAEASSDDYGNIDFPTLTMTAPGVYNYTIEEVTQSGDGWTADGNSYPIEVTVTDDGMGNLVADMDYPQGQPVFVNTYAAAPATVDVNASKSAEGGTFEAGQFEFELYDENGNFVAEASNDADGNIDFPTLILSAPGVYNYTVREITTSGNGWTTDSSSYTVEVTVTDDGMGNLVTDIDYPQGQPVFVNRYSPNPAKAALIAQTQLCGGCLQAQMFSFGLFSPDGKLVEKAANDSCGCVVFPALTFEKAGIYTYTILELPTSCRDLSASPCSYKAVVTVTDDGKGQLHATVSYEGGCPPLFVNCYRLSPQTMLFF